MQEERDQNYEGALKVLKLLLEGVCEALPPGLGISRLSKQIKAMISTLEKVLNTLGPSQCFYVVEILEFVKVIEAREQELGDLGELTRFRVSIVRMCVRAEAFGNTDIAGKATGVIQAVFGVSKKDLEIFIEILQELTEDTVEKWHNYDENVRVM